MYLKIGETLHDIVLKYVNEENRNKIRIEHSTVIDQGLILRNFDTKSV